MATRVKVKTSTPLQQRYVVVQSKRTNQRFLAKEEHAKRLQKENKYRITAREGERTFEAAKTKVTDKHNEYH